MSKLIQHVVFRDWLLSLTMVFSRFIHIIAPSIVCSFFSPDRLMFHYMGNTEFSPHSSIEGHSEFFYILVIVACVDIDVKVFV